MQTFRFTRAFAGLLLLASAFTMTACSSDDDKNTATLTVGTANILLGAEAGAAETFTVTTTAAWKAVASGGGFSLDRTEDTGDATIRVTATAAGANGEEKRLGSIAITATGVDGVKTVTVSQEGAKPAPTPGDVTLIVDFTQGTGIATPALPNQKAEATSGLKEYTIQGHTFVFFADAEENGVFYWIDNAVFNPALPEPNKGLYISKLGAYVKFPVIAGRTLAKVSYLSTSSQSGDTKIDLVGGDGEDIQYTFDAASGTYELIDAVQTARLEIINSKNAQFARLMLVYSATE